MSYSRIRSVIDIEKMQGSRVGLIGAGGSFDLGCNLVRSGLGEIVLTDYDVVDESNIARQGHSSEHIGQPKVNAMAETLGRINRATRVQCQMADFTGFCDDEIDALYGDCDLLIFGTDSFPCQARGNEVALRLDIPAIWIGLYPGGVAGEIIWWNPEQKPCFQCICGARYERQADVLTGSVEKSASSAGATVFDIAIVDGVAGQIAIGLLTQGANNRFGTLIDQLGTRQCLQIGIDPKWRLNGHDLVREQLGVAADIRTLFAWNTIARSDPDEGNPPCVDCQRFRNRVD